MPRGEDAESLASFMNLSYILLWGHLGDILTAKITPANVDTRKPVLELAKELSGKLYDDKGYISKVLSCDLFDKGIKLVFNVKKNMKIKLIST